jgi:NAD(P)-dependent dehydrogenase (short-subunit alcohol dehydrogenase family)
MKSSSSNVDRGPQTAVITGAAGAIGGAIARQLVADGWDVVGLDLQSGEHESVNWLTVDVTESEEIIAAASTLDRCDLLVNAAGFGDRAAAEEMTPIQWDRVVDVCLTGTFYTCRSFHPLLSGSGGVIVNIASAAATNALAMHANYCAAKAGVVALTEVLALEWAVDQIRVFAVSPGFVSTPRSKKGFAEAPHRKAGIEARTPMGRLAEIDEIAKAVIALASPDFAYLTGTNVIIDGGFSTDGGSSGLF